MRRFIENSRTFYGFVMPAAMLLGVVVALVLR